MLCAFAVAKVFKEQIESNSQLANSHRFSLKSCGKGIQRTNWKQFTTAQKNH